MNSVKTIVVVGVLLGVGYWVYHSIHNRQMPPLPTDFPDDWSEEVKVEMPDAPSESFPPALAGVPGTAPAAAPAPVTAQAPRA
ncbi:MAG TPA: hypothetical protein EYP56_20420, partial [Planctomycetaceae bacterium]|nr:hypothetical protein [Planctomycetaceae bacterium]